MLVGCEWKNSYQDKNIDNTQNYLHSICSGKLIASSQVRIQSKWQRQNWILFCNCRIWIILETSIKQRVNTSREHRCKKDTLKWRGCKQRQHLSLLTLIFFSLNIIKLILFVTRHWSLESKQKTWSPCEAEEHTALVTWTLV